MAGPVLVAEDRPETRQLLRAALFGWDVLEAQDGSEAWELLLAHRPPVAVLDVRMPGVDGLELTRRIRATPELAGTYVIVATSFAFERDVQASLDAGANRHLSKPYSVRELREAVAEGLAPQA